MGNKLAPPPIDDRVLKCTKRLSLPEEKINKLWRIFSKNDRIGDGYVRVEDYFDRLLRYPHNILGDSLLGLLDAAPTGKLEFGEFVDVTCTFAMFGAQDLLQFVYHIMDHDKTGFADKSVVKHLIYEIWENETNSNVTSAIKHLDAFDQGDGRLVYAHIRSLYEKYPMTFYPVFRLQNEIMKTSLGVDWWEEKKKEVREELQHHAEVKEKNEKKKVERLKHEEQKFNEEVVMKRMGLVRYYCMPWKRARERSRVAKIAAAAANAGTNREAEIFDE